MTRRIYWWLLALLIYAAGTLAWLGRFGTAEPLERSNRPERALPMPVPPSPDRSRSIRARSEETAPDRVAFEIPFTLEALERTEQYRFALLPGRGLERCTVQAIAECDHHFSFTRVYPDVALSGPGFVFVAPLTGDEAARYWIPVAHPGQWTDWERSGLRRLEVKVFAKSPIRSNVELRYRPVRAAEPVECRLAWSQVLTGPVPLGGRFELAFDLAGWHGNPFDYRALPVVLEVTPPVTAPRRLSPFLHQNFETVSGLDRERLRPCGPKHFLVRYRPGATGRHSYRLLCRAADGRERALDAGAFEVTDGTPPDFLRVSARRPAFFEHADGRFFYAIGWDIPYPVDRPYGQEYVPYLPGEKSLAFTRKLLDDLADAGGNFTRFWMADWWNGLEWNQSVDNYGGLGRYNLKNAWINDRILAQCERRGIYLQWETLTHASLKTDYSWPKHPYNVANGGFLRDWRDYWLNPKVLALSDNQLTYIVARYADSPAIHSWNAMSEPDILGAFQWPRAKAHILSRLRTLRALDPYGHITGNQLCLADRDPAFFRNTEVQFVSANAYAGGIAGLPEDQIPAIRGFSERYSGYGRPVMVAETVGHFAGDPAYKMRRDTLGALWSGVAGSLAGTPLSWWWNFNYGEDLGGGYRVVADFMKDEDLIGNDSSDKGTWRNRAVACTNRAGNLRALMAGSATRRFLFLYNFDTLCRTRGVPTRCAANRVTFGEMTPGDYVAEYWDLHRGKTAESAAFRVGGDGGGALDPPEFTEGWAVKIRPAPATAPAETAGHPGAGSLPFSAPPPPDPSPKAPDETAADWSWRLLPQCGVRFPAASERSVVEARIGLPEACRGREPSVTDERGHPAPFAWQSLGAGAGWRIVARAAGAGPLTVTAGGEATVAPPPPDEESWGLQAIVAPDVSDPLRTAPLFEQQFESLPDKRQARMSTIDQVENPMGENRDFLAVYRGPLLAPDDGDYAFASNSDDGSFVKIDGQVVVSRPGGCDMDVLNQPAANTWASRGTVRLDRGLHWVEYFHQQSGGACLARLGWRTPKTGHPGEALLAPPFADETASEAIAPVPEWALDGRLPCTLEVRYQGKIRLALEPCLGLELRRPRTPIAAAALRERGERRYELFREEGLHWAEAGGRRVPLWAWNPARRPFSLEWEECTTGTNGPFLKTLLYDIALPLTARIGDRAAGEQSNAARRWVAWPLTDRDRNAAFTVGLGTIPLLRGTLGGWPVVPDRTTPERRNSIALERLVEVGIGGAGPPLEGRRLAPWWNGTPPASIAPDRLSLDPWSGDPEDLVKALGGQRRALGVVVRLDRRALLLGLSGDAVYRRLHALLRAIENAEAVPVLALNPEFELDKPSAQAIGLAVRRLSLEFGCPFVDLRPLAR